jgi:hypothetical protein
MYDISIIIPVYCTTEESLDWFGECLESAKMQDCDIVIIDDGSPQDISKVAKQFRLAYHRIAHAGVSAARNYAVRQSTQSLIIPLDCDDRITKGAVRKLLSVWDGSTPVYPDIRKFGLETVDHYVLLDFDCDHIYNHVGFSSVNVLHKKDQWKSIGGWDELFDFYEDGFYNAKLFANFCGKRFPEPLIEYRIHDNQRTKVYKSRAYAYAKKIITRIRSLDMPCASCSKRRSQQLSNMGMNNPAAVAPTARIAERSAVDVSTLPGEIEGRVLALYIGGQGRGKHYYRGIVSSFPYKVVYGDYVYADPRDVKNEGDNNRSMLVKVKQQRVVIPERKVAPVVEPASPVAVVPVLVPEQELEPVTTQTKQRKPKRDMKRVAKE